MTFEELQKLVEEWSVKKDLNKADPRIQWMRVTEEIGEIRDVLLKPTKFGNAELALIDAIGDSLVTLIVLSQQLNINIVEALEAAYNEIKYRKGKMINGTFVKSEDL
ncbi:MazG-like family protein [Streptococcus halichoeri]|uniref:MazG-like family protein n=1 Tax=Streptococcus halichoeri TaxID=254785 RepID=UPI001358610F|nr:MazG-like family protein [Streptococcus halichoeri]